MAAPSWFHSLQFRLILAFTATLALALAAVAAYVGLAAERETENFRLRNQEFRAGRVHHLIASHYANHRDWAGLQPSLEQAASLYGRRFLVIDREGQVVGDSHHRRGRGKFRDPARADNGPGRRLPIVVDDREVGALVLAAGNADADTDADADGDFPAATGPGLPPPGAPVREPAVSRLAAGVQTSLWWTGLAAAAGGILIMSLISRRLLAPVQTLSAAARRLGQGDLSQRVPAAGPEEIRRLGQTFNTMAENLQAAERQRRNLAADLAHELRTPLSNIQGYLEAVNDGLLQPDKATIDTLRQQTGHLVTLVEDLRLLALAEAGALRLDLQEESIEEILADVVEAFRPRAAAKPVRLSLEPAEPAEPVESETEPALPPASAAPVSNSPAPVAPVIVAPVVVDRTRIAQVVGNLLENGIFHTPPGGAVTVTAARRGSLVAVSITDTGPGIPPEDLPRLFDRFYRADPSRTRATGGAGLGLTIARQLVEAHGGNIWAESRPATDPDSGTESNPESGLEVGSRFTFTLPLAGAGGPPATGHNRPTGPTIKGG